MADAQDLNAGHRERVRTRFKKDPTSLADYELLELLLGYVYLRKDTKPLAKRLLKRFGSISGIIMANHTQLCEEPGIGPSGIFLVEMLREIIARFKVGEVQNKERVTPGVAARMLCSRLGAHEHEEVWALLLDNGCRLISLEHISTGTVDSSLITLRMVAKVAYAKNASGVILAHNHPGGNLSPSAKDLALTKQMESAALDIGLRFEDHFIVTDKACYSLKYDHQIEPG